ncbi:adenosine deaminase [Frankia casuarinae]|uniref:Adenosine deaminase n=1 Tax=Frankia casuarinae (strain DSM 45818 / CECT 9043 / HFP020203 / CcI3) TaxID=106370 RepID=Q2JFM4_FRACC|nr:MULTISPECIES: adenosine deaminase [Frankia]ABD09918.1 adenosine deaminase [Frankia casuarinae]ETA04373.1 adenosine deaminase [Frankia sp. CcI6]EYT89859.1 adenosine deaminase [Frankia casuarinae]KDA44929.1 adenosine deaminase [Frankia sp. BMG5.23]KEZ38127.1 adenosine deaminase [Frankia sp. CeD]
MSDPSGFAVPSPTGPKIELHVHLEGTVRPATLLEMARRNSEALPARTVEGLADLYRFRDFDHFLKAWILTTHVMRTEADFRQVVVDYAAEAARAGAVYLEGIFSPWFRVHRGVRVEEIFHGYADGAIEARERYGVEVRLTPDIERVLPVEAAMEVARWAVRFADRGVVGIGLGGPEVGHPPEPFAPAFALAADGGLAAVPHAGETAGPVSVRGALDALGARRIRHGIRAAEDPELMRRLVDQGIVLDVCPVSNLRTRSVASLDDHPLAALLRAGVACSLATDDPAMFGTDLETEHAVAAGLGARARDLYTAGVAGALCDEPTRTRLRRIGESTDWDTVERAARDASAAASARFGGGEGAW